MTTPATAIKSEIQQLIDIQIQVFGRPAQLTSFELEECRRRTERIKQLGQQLDQCSTTAILQQRFGRVA